MRQVAFAVILVFLLFGCAQVSDTTARRFALNSVAVSSSGSSHVCVDFNYTPSRAFADVSIDFGRDFFWLEASGQRCNFTTINAEEVKSGYMLNSEEKAGLDGKSHRPFYLGRSLDQPQTPRLVMEGFVDESCMQLLDPGSKVTVSVSAIDNQNDINEVLNPHRETISGIVSVTDKKDIYEMTGPPPSQQAAYAEAGCASYKDQKGRDECYQQLSYGAGKNGAVYCEKIANVTIKENCYYGIVTVTDNISICDEKIKDPLARYICHKYVAIQTKNSSICDLVESDTWKAECRQQVGAS